MNAFKIVGLVILSFLLFASLSVFGAALTVNNTALNPGFIPAQVDRLDISELLDESISRGDVTDMPSNVRTALIGAIDKLEPDIKSRLRRANSRVYDYLLGRATDIDLAAILKEEVLDREFVASAVDRADVTSLVRESLRDELVDLIPPDLSLIERLVLVRYLDEALPSVDPWTREQVELASGPVVDYLLGESPTLRVVVNLGPLKATLRDSLRTAFLRSPPPGIPQAQLNATFDQVYEQYAAEIPATSTIDEESLGTDLPVSISQALYDAETGLVRAKSAIGTFRAYFVVIIVLVILLIAGIVILHREVKGATRDLGIVFLVYGALTYTGILIGKYFITMALDSPDVTATVQAWLRGLFADMFRPLEMLGLALAVVGIALIVVSILYRRTLKATRVVATDQQP